jgi:hypothetical protein
MLLLAVLLLLFAVPVLVPVSRPAWQLEEGAGLSDSSAQDLPHHEGEQAAGTQLRQQAFVKDDVALCCYISCSCIACSCLLRCSAAVAFFQVACFA